MGAVRSSIVALLGCATACRFNPNAQSGDAGTGDGSGVQDGAGDGMHDGKPIDAPPAVTCWSSWLTGPLTVDSPIALSEINDLTHIDRDPFVMPDELTIYWSSDRGLTGSSGGMDIYSATRAIKSDPFGSVAVFAAVNSAQDETKMSITSDGLQLFLSSTRTGTEGGQDVFASVRGATNQTFPTLSQDHLQNVDTPQNEFDACISSNGLDLYLAPDTGGQHIALATRSTTSDDFSAYSAVANIKGADGTDADPTVSPDERVLVFTSSRSGGVGGSDLYYATRSAATGQFGTPVIVPTVNSASNDGDATLSACLLYTSPSPRD